jgi:Tol biopolymer transport system component
MAALLNGRPRRTPVRAIGAAVLSLATLVASAGGARASYPGQDGELAFDRPVGNHPQIYGVNTAGKIRELTRGLSPAWSPSGDRLAFSLKLHGGSEEIFLANRNGSHRHRLTHNKVPDVSPSFSPPGRTRRVVFGRYPRHQPSVRSEVVAADVDGDHRRVLAKERSFADPEPKFSPAGRWIAYAQDVGAESAIYLMRPDGSDKHRITSRAADAADFDWSPNGRQLIYREFDPVKGATSLVETRPDGSGRRVVVSAGANRSVGHPIYAPDGKRIAFVDGVQGQRLSIWTAAVDGSDELQLTPVLGRIDTLAWQPKRGP